MRFKGGQAVGKIKCNLPRTRISKCAITALDYLRDALATTQNPLWMHSNTLAAFEHTGSSWRSFAQARNTHIFKELSLAWWIYSLIFTYACTRLIYVESYLRESSAGEAILSAGYTPFHQTEISHFTKRIISVFIHLNLVAISTVIYIYIVIFYSEVLKMQNRIVLTHLW